MDVKELIKAIEGMELSEEEKTLMIGTLNEKGEEAIMDVLTLLELKTENARLVASALQETGEQVAGELDDMADDLDEDTTQSDAPDSTSSAAA